MNKAQILVLLEYFDENISDTDKELIKHYISLANMSFEELIHLESQYNLINNRFDKVQILIDEFNSLRGKLAESDSEYKDELITKCSDDVTIIKSLVKTGNFDNATYEFYKDELISYISPQSGILTNYFYDSKLKLNQTLANYGEFQYSIQQENESIRSRK